MTIFIYPRVSHTYSAQSGLSIDDQIERNIAYAINNIPNDSIATTNYNCDIPGVFADKAVSAWKKNFFERPAGRMLWRNAQPGDHVICYSIDRMSRNLRDFCNITWAFERRGIFLHYPDEMLNSATAFGRLVMHQRAAMAQYQSDLTSERIRESHLIREMGYSTTSNVRNKQKWLHSALGIRANDTPIKDGRPSGTVYRYERVSDHKQYTSGLGLQVQTTANERFAQQLADRRGSKFHPEPLQDPAISAFKIPFANRKAAKKLLSMLQPGDDIVIYRFDRAWRNGLEALQMHEELKKKQVAVHLVCEGLRTDTEEGEQWIGLLAWASQLESKMKSRRNYQVAERLRQEGRPAGNCPIGTRKIQVPGGLKLGLNDEKIKEKAFHWLLYNDLKMSQYSVRDTFTARRARLRGASTATFDDIKWPVAHVVLDKQVEKIKQRIGEDLWNEYLEQGREELKQPFTKGQLRFSKLVHWPAGVIDE